MSFHIALTGGIASGKTQVSNFFASLGIDVIDADLVAREVVEPQTKGLDSIVEYFGDKVLTADGFLDRAALRKIVFADSEKRQWLNQLLHPMIRTRMNQLRVEATSPYSISAIPLLAETSQAEVYDRVLVIDCPVNLQIKRLMQRDKTSYTNAQAVLASQASRHQRLSIADDIIKNDSDLQSLEQQVINLDNQYRQLAQGI